MSSFLENEILKSFLERIKEDTTLPVALVASIQALHKQDKLAKGTNLKKLIEELVPESKEKSDEGK